MTDINLDSLDTIFGATDEAENEIQNELDFSTEIDYDDPKSILKANIFKANALLDKIQEEINRGNFSARMVEVAGNILNNVTASTKEIIGKETSVDMIEVKKELVKLKAKEIEIKAKALPGGKTTIQNAIITSREDLLKVLDEKKPRISELKRIN